MPHVLMAGCALSARVPHDATLCGMAFDVDAAGGPGRLKLYFQSGPADLSWLSRWYDALASLGTAAAPAARRDVQQLATRLALPVGAGRWPAKTCFVGLEFDTAGQASLKTDFATCRWLGDDAAAASAVRAAAHDLNLDASPYDAACRALGLDAAARPTGAACHQLVGLGFEPDGRRHLNVYLAPPVAADRAPQAPAAQGVVA